MLTVVVVLKALCEIAVLALIGQGLLRVLAGAQASQNVFYGMLSTITLPARRVAAFLSPSFVSERQHGLVAFCLLCAAWLGLTIWKIRLVLGEAPTG